MEKPSKGTVVLIHGLWLTPRAWEHWVDRYTQLGYRVLAPAWPGMEGEVEALRQDPSGMKGVGIGEAADHFEQIIRGLDAPPIIIGHSFGGVLVQILLDRKLGAAGVAIDSTPVRGVLQLGLQGLKSALPVLSKPAIRGRTLTLTPKQWHQGFANTLTGEEAKAAYDRYLVPTPGRPLWQAVTANLVRHAATRVNLRNAERAPLLLIAGGADQTVSPALSRKNFQRYHSSSAVTDYKEFPGRPHFSIGVPGWEELADYALEWAERHRLPQARAA